MLGCWALSRAFVKDSKISCHQIHYCLDMGFLSFWSLLGNWVCNSLAQFTMEILKVNRVHSTFHAIPTFLSTLLFGEWRGKPLPNLATSGIVSLCYCKGLFCHIDDFIICLWHLNRVYITLCTKFNVMHKMSHPIYHATTLSFCALH
jgi:hypothetical protein